jgi:hypothetical protein
MIRERASRLSASLALLYIDTNTKAPTIRRATDCIKATNFVARLGGDEFAIVQTTVKGPADIATTRDSVIPMNVSVSRSPPKPALALL